MSTAEAVIALIAAAVDAWQKSKDGKTVDPAAIQSALAAFQASLPAQLATDDAAATAAEAAKFPGQ